MSWQHSEHVFCIFISASNASDVCLVFVWCIKVFWISCALLVQLNDRDISGMPSVRRQSKIHFTNTYFFFFLKAKMTEDNLWIRFIYSFSRLDHPKNLDQSSSYPNFKTRISCASEHGCFDSERRRAKNISAFFNFFFFKLLCNSPPHLSMISQNIMHLQSLNKIFTLLFPFSKKLFLFK